MAHRLDGGNVIAELSNGTLTAKYLRGMNLISRTDSSRTTYYLFNAHGDVVDLANSSGSSVKSYDYDAFGNEKSPSASDRNPFRYCGEYWDTETGTYYLRARYYDPLIGRFTQQDSHWTSANAIYGDNPNQLAQREDALGLTSYTYSPQISCILQSGNLYVYCINDPINGSDEDGKSALAVAGLYAGKAAWGVASLYISDVIINIARGETGWDIMEPRSTKGEYMAAAATALLPGSGFGNAAASGVITEGFRIAEKAINGQPIDWEASGKQVVLETGLNLAFNGMADATGKAIDNHRPKNYSTYAGQQRKKTPNATTKDLRWGYKITKWNHNAAKTSTKATIGIVRNCVPVRLCQ